MKEKLLFYLKNNIPWLLIELNKVYYYDYVKNKKKEFVMKFIFDDKIKKVHIINDWFDKFVEDKDNHSTIITYIEVQSVLSEKWKQS